MLLFDLCAPKKKPEDKVRNAQQAALDAALTRVFVHGKLPVARFNISIFPPVVVEGGGPKRSTFVVWDDKLVLKKYLIK